MNRHSFCKQTLSEFFFYSNNIAFFQKLFILGIWKKMHISANLHADAVQ